MVNRFIFYSDSSFDLKLSPICPDSSVTGTINWGDGTVTDYVYDYNTHSYSSGGTYIVTYTTTDFETIGYGTFASNKYITNATLDDGLKTIGAGTFYYVTSMSTLNVPSGAVVTASSCVGAKFTSVNFGNKKNAYTRSLTENDKNAFQDCTDLEYITIYTDDTTLQGTTNNTYFLANSDGTSYIPVKYEAIRTPIIITDIPKSNYITVYDMVETNFSHNGLRILQPISCTITEELNGTYELTLEHPVDNDNAWLAIKEFNFIKALGQLFRIYKKTTKLKSNGVATRTANAQHVFYDLAHKLIKSCDISGLNGQGALDQIHSSIFDDNIDGVYLDYVFTHYSDITNTISLDTSYELTSPVACLIGEDNCVANRLNGELYRDNFYYSICNRREGSIDNAFNIVHGINMLEVEEVVDYSNLCTYLHTFDNYGNVNDVAYVSSPKYPHNYSLGKMFNYNECNFAELASDMSEYFEEHWEPTITYTVNVAKLKNSEMYKDFTNIANFNVGDTGTIYSEELGISTQQKIIKKVTDALTGEVTSLTLGNFKGSVARRDRFENTIARSDNLVRRMISPYTCTDITQADFNALEKFKEKHTYYVYK
jgi:phage minor structural protein